MRLEFGWDTIWNCLGKMSMRCDWNWAQTQFGIVLEYFRPRKEGREFRLILTKQEGREGKVKGKEVKLPSGKRVSIDRTAFLYQLQNEATACVSLFEHWANRVEPRSNAFEVFPFPSFVQFHSFSFLLYCALFHSSSSSQVSQYRLQFSC